MTRTPWITDYLNEVELDEEGNPIETIEGPKLTVRSRAAERAWLQMLYRPKRLEPTDQLPPELLVRHTRRKGWEEPPRYNFGWGLSTQQLVDYCIRRRLLPKKCHGRDWSCMMIQASVKELDRLCGAKLYLQSLSDADHDWVLARYSNYTWYEEVLKERDEREVIEIVQRELCIPDSPKWYRQQIPDS